MAFRSQARTGILIAICMAFGVAARAIAAEFPARHVHLKGGGDGVLTVSEQGIGFRENKERKQPHEWKWSWNDVQRVELRTDRIEVVTYKDKKLLAGRDERYVFEGEGFESAYPLLRDRLPRRVVADVAAPLTSPAAIFLAKRQQGNHGWEGRLLIGDERIVFQSAAAHGSHTWPLAEVENISSSDPLELTIASLGTEYRIQLKEPLPEDTYNQLWRKLNVRSTH